MALEFCDHVDIVWLAYVTHVLASYLRRFDRSLAVALDTAKAFERVWHLMLIAKLPSLF